MTPHAELRQFLAQRQTRRAFLGRTSQGIGALALASLLNPTLLSGAAAAARTGKWTGVVNPLDYPQKAKRVIWLSMAGGRRGRESDQETRGEGCGGTGAAWAGSSGLG
jgi:hypothetical protein